MIRECTDTDFDEIHEIVNDAALEYKGVIPADRWHEPYMSKAHLRAEMADGVRFWGIEDEQGLAGVMGIQDRGEVCLIRHAYVRTKRQNTGLGARLLKHLESTTGKTILIGTWSAAEWAVRFYEKNGYQLLTGAEKNDLLRRYWRIPERQVETSVVLAKYR